LALTAPEHIRSNYGPEFVARNVREWVGRVGVMTLFIEQTKLSPAKTQSMGWRLYDRFLR
jgi:hypothetical protein